MTVHARNITTINHDLLTKLSCGEENRQGVVKLYHKNFERDELRFMSKCTR